MANRVFKTPGEPAPAVLLHSSGSTANQWRDLTTLLAAERTVATPEQWGCGATPPWAGKRPFSLAEEAAPVIELIEATRRRVHLVGHSYGGGVALHIARRRPELLSSLTLIEPTAFHLLKDGSGEDLAALREIVSVAEAIGLAIQGGRPRYGMARFVDYWNGAGAWDGMPTGRQDTLIARVAKVPLDFRALLHEEATVANVRSMTVPTLLVRGSESPRPAIRVAEVLSRTLPQCTTVEIAGAGHMVPLTHGPDVNPLIRDFVARHDRAARLAA